MWKIMPVQPDFFLIAKCSHLLENAEKYWFAKKEHTGISRFKVLKNKEHFFPLLAKIIRKAIQSVVFSWFNKVFSKWWSRNL